MCRPINTIHRYHYHYYDYIIVLDRNKRVPHECTVKIDCPPRDASATHNTPEDLSASVEAVLRCCYYFDFYYY